MDGLINQLVDGSMEWWMDGWIDRQTDRQTEIETPFQTPVLVVLVSVVLTLTVTVVINIQPNDKSSQSDWISVYSYLCHQPSLADWCVRFSQAYLTLIKQCQSTEVDIVNEYYVLYQLTELLTVVSKLTIQWVYYTTYQLTEVLISNRAINCSK